MCIRDSLSAEQGNQFAQYSLGRLYLDGREDFSPDTRQAERWLTLSAEQGNQFAQYSLGKLYYYGRGIDVYKRQGVPKHQGGFAYPRSKYFRTGFDFPQFVAQKFLQQTRIDFNCKA